MLSDSALKKPPFPAYQGDEPYVFVCYAHDDSAVVYPELERLRSAGFNLWYDEGISPGSEWSESIAEHIQRSAVFLYFVTPRAVEREHCRQEVNFALDQSCQVLAVHLEPTDLPPALKLSLSHRQAILKHRLDLPAYHDKLRRSLQNALGDVSATAAGETGRRPVFLLAGFPYGGLAPVALLVLAAAIVGWMMLEDQRPASPTTPTVAVLPVQVLSSDGRIGAFGEIVRQDLVRELAETPLRVIAADDPASADFLVESSLRPVEEDVQIAVLVVRSSDRHVHWSKVRRVEGTDLGRFRHASYFAYMTRLVVQMVLDSEDQTTSDHARDSWIEGVLEFGELARGVDGDWRAAEAHLIASLEADQSFVLPAFQLGILYKNRMGFRLTHADAVEPAHRYARRVLDQEPDWTFLVGTINAQLDLDYGAAIANLEHVRKNEPGFTLGEIESEIAAVLLWQGNSEEALARCEAATRLDPGTNQNLIEFLMATAYLSTNRLQKAARIVEDAATLLEGSSPMNIAGHLIRVRSHFYSESHFLANEALDAAWSRYGSSSPELFPGVMALLGKNDRAAQLLQESEELYQEGRLTIASESFWGEFHLGNLDKAFVWLQRAIDNREFWLFPYLHHSAVLDSIRSDPRFQQAMRHREQIEAQGTPTHTVAYP